MNSPRYIKKEGYEASVVYQCSPQPEIKEALKARADQLDCPLMVIEDHGVRDFSIIRKLLKICREENIGLLQTNHDKSNAVGLNRYTRPLRVRARAGAQRLPVVSTPSYNNS